MSRLAQAYEDSKLLYFVTDGEGNCMLDRVSEVDARIFAMKNGWSVGRHDEKDDTGVKINDQGLEVSYENKDELSEDDFASYGGM
jgi:hypothetical protein